MSGQREHDAHRRLVVSIVAALAFALVLVGVWPYFAMIGANAEHAARLYLSTRRPDVRWALSDPVWRAETARYFSVTDAVADVFLPVPSFSGELSVEPIASWKVEPGEAVFDATWHGGGQCWIRMRRSQTGLWRVTSVDSGG